MVKPFKIDDFEFCTPFSQLTGRRIKRIKDFKTYADKTNMRRNETFRKVRKLLDNPKTSTADLAEVISEDPSLSGSLLHFIKSFGFPPEACTLSGAINLLGVDAIRNIVTGHLNQ